MATVTLLVLQGLERGEQFSDIAVPLTIGREEENAIQLNDERISRCHVKLQQDQGQIILTDLESTNGSRVNGLPVKMTVLRPGDLISIGRCVLLFGSHDQIKKHCHELHLRSLEVQCLANPADDSALAADPADDSPDSEQTFRLFDEHGQPVIAFPNGRPALPTTQSLAARSQLQDLVAYFHVHLLHVLESRDLNRQTDHDDEPNETYARIPWPLWFLLLDLEADLSRYLREIPEPE